MARKDMTYEQAAHAMQSGVAFDQGSGSEDGNPKYLRTGLNSALVNQCAVARLLIAKGVFTESEYVEAVRLEMILEVERYEARLSEKHGKIIRLG